MGMRGKFDEDLKNIQKMVQELGDLAIESLNSAMEGVEALDKEKAKIAIEKDQRAYELMQSIEKECTATIMLQAPVAKDLRKIVTALKSSMDLDRIVRYSRNISLLAMEMIEEKDGHFKKLVGLKGMRKMTAEMIENSLKALLEENKEIAMKVYEAEKDVDALYEQIFRELITYMIEDNKKIGRGVRYLLVGRYLERIADHACNIAESAIYVSTGERIPPD